MIIMQHTGSKVGDTVVHDDGTVYTDGALNTIGTVEIVAGAVIRLDVNGDGNFDIDTEALLE